MCPGQFPVFHSHLSIDDDMVHTDGSLVRLKGGALIGEGCWIEDCHIRPRPLVQHTPVA